MFAFAQDFTVMGGSLSEAVSQKICKLMDLAAKSGSPLVGVKRFRRCPNTGGCPQPGRLRRNLSA